jgi:glycosyltransferase involved in cell wall biosynthesis
VLEEVWEYLQVQKYDWELILSDDGSTDGTGAALEKFAAKHRSKGGRGNGRGRGSGDGGANGEIKVLLNAHGGKAQTVTAGMLAAKGKWRLFTDFDQSTPLSEVEKLLAAVGRRDGSRGESDGGGENEVGIIFGSRELSGAQRQKEPWYRHLMGRGFNILVQFLAVPGVLDTQCGFKMFEGEVAEKLFARLYVYGAERNRKKDAFTGAFDVELFYLARKLGVNYKEVAIVWKHNETDRVSPIKDSVRMLLDILKIRLADLNGKYLD